MSKNSKGWNRNQGRKEGNKDLNTQKENNTLQTICNSETSISEWLMNVF
jgi:hypothetical protein